MSLHDEAVEAIEGEITTHFVNGGQWDDITFEQLVKPVARIYGPEVEKWKTHTQDLIGVIEGMLKTGGYLTHHMEIVRTAKRDLELA